MKSEIITRVYRAYRNNFVSDLSNFSRDFRHRVFEYLRQERGHHSIRPMLLHVMAMIPAEGVRLSQLAALLEMNTQHCMDLVKEFEATGYLRRTDDPLDSRARLVHITKQGKSLFYDTIDFGKTRDPFYQALLTPARFVRFEKISCELNDGMKFAGLRSRQFPEYLDRTGSQLYGHLIQAEAYAQRFINRYLVASGHNGVKENIRWLIEQISNGHDTIAGIAKLRDISVQAMGRIVKDAEAAQYLKSLPDVEDRRRKTLLITERGLELLADTVDAVSHLETEFTEVIGAKKFQLFKRELAIFSGRSPTAKAAEEPAPMLFYRPSEQRPVRIDESAINHFEILVYIAYLLDQAEPTSGSSTTLTQSIDASIRGDSVVMLAQSTLDQLNITRVPMDTIEAKLIKKIGKRTATTLADLINKLKQ